jgi:F-box and leucine-rich repeat protein GRR1
MSKYCPLLTKAILDECINITEDGLIPLLSECPYIQRLTLTGVVHVTDRCIVQAVNAHGLRHIKELNLSGCKNITDIAVSAIARNCALLNELSLSGCVNVTSKSVIELADSCQILLSLNIFGCKHIRSDIVSHLAQHCKLLEKVVGVMNSGMADVTVKDLPFLVE